MRLDAIHRQTHRMIAGVASKLVLFITGAVMVLAAPVVLVVWTVYCIGVRLFASWPDDSEAMP